MKRRGLYIVTALLLAALALTLRISLQNGEKRIREDADRAFKTAVERHYTERIERFRYADHRVLSPDVERYASVPAFDRKIKNYTLHTPKGKMVYTFRDSLSETKAKRLLNEYILAGTNPVNPDKLNALFQEQLALLKIDGKTGTVYRNGKMRRCSRDSLPPSSAYFTPLYALDITGEVKAQAWVDYGFLTVWRHVDSTFYWFLSMIAAGVGGYLYIWRLRRRERSVRGIVIDLGKQELYVDGVQCAIPKLDLALLNLLLERKGECVSREEIKRCFWEKDENADEKIDTHIKMLRKILRDFPEHRIVTVRGRGYYLVIGGSDTRRAAARPGRGD